jgi:hypothetical protein
MRNSRDTGIWSKGQNNENKNQYKNNDLRYRSTLELSKTTISGIDLHWNYQKHISLGSIYTGTIKNTYPSTFGSYIKELLIQKYWQLISTKSTELSHPSPELSSTEYRAWCPIQYRNCPGTEMSRIFYGDGYLELPKSPMEKRNAPELGVLYYYKHFYENWLRNDDFIVILVLISMPFAILFMSSLVKSLFLVCQKQ